ncbi:glycosyl transferase family 90 [Marinomonas aquiplantarum]|uniref:Glycosyl transferase family 90 n=1 Tax=Marinomonas aquiplantarum TaxID=491951 RepID=A0A366CSY7_9GAMM|nr:glycosyl transferase family 90 [Marinomonas aquiplantarum]RBO78472.1 glycosyl transferase family 90 [Marinomonas aquiplantarum]
MKRKNWEYYKNRWAKIRYYISETLLLKKPVKSAHDILNSAVVTEQMRERADYCCKLDSSFSPSENSVSVGEFKKTKSFVYFADTKRVVSHFPKDKRFDYVFGDVTHVPDVPSFVKSRPIIDNNQNSVLLKLNAIRHYQFVDDKVSFEDKIPMAVWRGMVHHQHRQDFVELYYKSSLADVGHNDVGKKGDGYKGYLTVSEQLKYKYVVSIEGKDVATNLKWAMNSNSLVMMRKPRYETWFMEGMLKPDYHYVLLKDDFSDLEEKILYYNAHPEEAKTIIQNANEYVIDFKDDEKELLVSLLVADKYYRLTALG